MKQKKKVSSQLNRKTRFNRADGFVLQADLDARAPVLCLVDQDLRIGPLVRKIGHGQLSPVLTSSFFVIIRPPRTVLHPPAPAPACANAPAGRRKGPPGFAGKLSGFSGHFAYAFNEIIHLYALRVSAVNPPDCGGFSVLGRDVFKNHRRGAGDAEFPL